MLFYIFTLCSRAEEKKLAVLRSIDERFHRILLPQLALLFIMVHGFPLPFNFLQACNWRFDHNLRWHTYITTTFVLTSFFSKHIFWAFGKIKKPHHNSRKAEKTHSDKAVRSFVLGSPVFFSPYSWSLIFVIWHIVDYMIGWWDLLNVFLRFCIGVLVYTTSMFALGCNDKHQREFEFKLRCVKAPSMRNTLHVCLQRVMFIFYFLIPSLRLL